jgi:hypothetical protein
MSGDGGLVLVLCGALALIASLTERVIAQRRWLDATIETVLDPAMRAAFPPPAQAWELERLAAEADAVLESHEIRRRQQRASRH